MTTVEASQSATWARPRLRPGVVLGPGVWRDGKLVHHVMDPETGWYYRVGPREHFLMSRMDGTRGLDDLAGEYATAYQRRLGPENWQQLFGMLHQRQLLHGATDPDALAELTASAAAGAAKARRGPLSARLPLFDPQRLFTRVLPWLAPVFTWWFVVPALLLALAVAGYVVWQLPELAGGVGGGRPLPAILIAVVVTWLIVFLHECAHGLTCRHFGGRVTEIGVMWRFPLLAPYCKVDDVVLFTPRRRVATAFAGVFVSMLALVPFAALRLWGPPDGMLYDLAGTMLLFGTATAAINLVPFLRLDGYHMLSHALNLADLRADTYRFYRRLLRQGPQAVRDYRPRDRLAYALYGLASALFAGTVLSLLIHYWYTTLARWVGPGWSITILIAEAALLTALLTHHTRRRPAPPRPR
ncbi:M50 family peptidase [Micromonospora zingiberis]|uniref:M50 family peptidase n=1 Tax=Micromonospora zingiberis TaxID=2053011 RepID=A0A4R0GYC1_9ACTN|nr:M50 family metallopeptidase [Micromonospora zingiberis]TCC00489.1 M50 family peptidase [Micromonospora zingiberis]